MQSLTTPLGGVVAVSRLFVIGVVVAVMAAIAVFTMTPEAAAQEPDGFVCASDAGDLSWSDDDQSKYWIYKSAAGAAGFEWLGRTTGATSFTDPNPTVGATYQVHYAGIDRVACATTAEPPETSPSTPFACASDAGVLSWSDDDQSKYWLYKSASNGADFKWLGRTTGATSFTDPNPTVGATYQVHYAGISRVLCATTAEPDVGRTVALPGVIEAENFVSAVDSNAGNQGPATQFEGDADVWPKLGDNGFILGEIYGGESTTYHVSVATDGFFQFVISSASGNGAYDTPGVVQLAVDGQDATDTILLSDTGQWWTFADTDLGPIYFEAGEHAVTVKWLGRYSGRSNFDKLTVNAVNGDRSTCVANGVKRLTALSQLECDALSVLISDAVPVGRRGDPCGWVYVACSDDQTTVTKVSVYDLSGPLSPVIGDLTNLTHLDFDDSYSDGYKEVRYGSSFTSLPPEIGKLTKLTDLDLRGSALTELPSEFANLVNLVNLDLTDNGLTSLPSEIANLTNLRFLFLEQNYLSGDITPLASLEASVYLSDGAGFNNCLTTTDAAFAQRLSARAETRGWDRCDG